MPTPSFARIAGYFAIVAAMAFGGAFAVAVFVPARVGADVAWFVKCVLVMCLVTAVTWFYMRHDGVTWKRYGVARGAGIRVIGGLGAGLLLAGAWSSPVYLVTPFHWSLNDGLSWTTFVLGTFASVGMGIAEEVGYRTYGMDCLLSRAGPMAAVLVPTVIFAGMHIAGGVPWQAGLLVVGSASVMYGCLMLATRSLPFVAAFHIANNVGQDAWLRTGTGSLWRPVFESDIPASSQPTIWTGMMVLNLIVATGAWAIWRAARKQTDNR
jgi:membrane protease YdiL (CAAX protease family)